MKIWITILLFTLSSLSYAQIDSIAKTTNASYHKFNKKYKGKELFRTSESNSILEKYINVYKSCGGKQFIISLQQNFKLKQINDNTYQLKIKDTGRLTYEDEAFWQSFLWCPIGKPDGSVILVDGNNIKRREYNYKNEMLNGRVAFFNEKGGITSEYFYVNDSETK